jgi:hypothetical protein
VQTTTITENGITTTDITTTDKGGTQTVSTSTVNNATNEKTSISTTYDNQNPRTVVRQIKTTTDADGYTTTNTAEGGIVWDVPTITTTTDKDGKTRTAKYRTTYNKDGSIFVEWEDVNFNLPPKLDGSGHGIWYLAGTEIKPNITGDGPFPYIATPPPRPPSPGEEKPPEEKKESEKPGEKSSDDFMMMRPGIPNTFSGNSLSDLASIAVNSHASCVYTPAANASVLKPLSPGIPGTARVYIAIDGVRWCSYGDGHGVVATIIPTDGYGVPVAVATAGTSAHAVTEEGVAQVAERTTVTAAGESPVADGTPIAGDTKSAATDQVPSTPQTPPPAASAAPPQTPTPSASTLTTDTPPVTDNQPPADTPSTPDTIVVTIFYKVNEDALKQNGNGSELPSQTQKLLFATPDLPASGTNKMALDKDFDRDPVQGKSDPHGNSTIAMHLADLSAYGLTNVTPGHYRVDLNLLQNSGVVAETTGRTVPSDLASITPAGGHIVATTFKIGGQTMTRLEIESPYGVNAGDLAPYVRLLGPKVVIDYCRTTKPGMPLGERPDSLSAINHEVARATLRLDRRLQTRGTAR